MKHNLLLLVSALSLCLGASTLAQNAVPAPPSIPSDPVAAPPEPAPPRVARRPTPAPRQPATLVPANPFSRTAPSKDPFTAAPPIGNPDDRPAPVPTTPRPDAADSAPNFGPGVIGPKPDPFANNAPSRPKEILKAVTPNDANLTVRYEVFSLPMAFAADLMRRNHAHEDLYQTIVTMVSADHQDAAQETLSIITLRSGQRGETSAITEHIYPTEYDPPNIPTAFETRNVGVSVEAEAILKAGGALVDLSVAPEHVTLARMTKWGPAETPQEMPEFECQRLNTTTQVSVGTPRFLGTINRPPSSTAEPKTKGQVWFAFVTVSQVN